MERFCIFLPPGEVLTELTVLISLFLILLGVFLPEQQFGHAFAF